MYLNEVPKIYFIGYNKSRIGIGKVIIFFTKINISPYIKANIIYYDIFLQS